jgi:glycosyltransferase involved in cell wall biosynthesis
MRFGLTHLEVTADLDPGYGEDETFIELEGDGEQPFDLVCVNPDELPKFAEAVGESFFAARPSIGVWGWETNAIPQRWAAAFELIDEIWVYSRFMAENLSRVSPVPVVPLPPPVAVPDPAGAPFRLGVPDGFLFLFVFDYLSTIQRKNPVGLVQAFQRAFAPGEGPQLLIKTINAPLRPHAEEELLWAGQERPDIHVVDCSLSVAQRDALMATCDCYVSLHRSEGFGLTLAECMALGKAVIATGYSGNIDFMTPANSYLIDYRMTRVGPGCEIYPPEGEWAEPDVDQAAELMRMIWRAPDAARSIGDRARADIAATLSPEATGRLMRARLERLAGRLELDRAIR